MNRIPKKLVAVGYGIAMLFASASHVSAFYNPSTGRWLTRDPIGEKGFVQFLSHDSENPQTTDNDNLFLFVENVPTDKVDALGLHTFKGCLKKQEDDIKSALRNGCKKAKECGAKCPSGGFPLGIGKMCDGNNLTFNCVDKDFVAAGGITYNDACAMARGSEIFLWPSPGRCGGLSCVLFHEAGHVGGLPGNKKVPHPPADFNTFAKCMGCVITW